MDLSHICRIKRAVFGVNYEVWNKDFTASTREEK
jgi:hypothetical protein